MTSTITAPPSSVERGLPPGLWLPLPEESTEQYKREVFDHSDHDYADIVDFGGFVVALAVWGAEETGRTNLMPTRNDVLALCREGYGVSDWRMRRTYDGHSRLQQTLGFYPRGYVPARSELLGRFRWLASHALDPVAEFGTARPRIAQIQDWGTARNLLPTEKITYEVMGGNLGCVLDMFSIERRTMRKEIAISELYRLGAEVIRAHGQPLGQVQLDREYTGWLNCSAYKAIQTHFGTLNAFWREFGFIPDASGMTTEDLVNAGIRTAIATGRAHFSKDRITELSKQKRFPSMQPINRQFGGVTTYQAHVSAGYQRYLTNSRALLGAGASAEVVQLACRNFEPTSSFEHWLHGQARLWRTLSQDAAPYPYIRRIMQHGFDLTDPVIRRMQKADFLRALKRSGITGADLQQVRQLVPRLAPGDLQ